MHWSRIENSFRFTIRSSTCFPQLMALLVANQLADFSLNGFFKELQRFPARPLVIVMESDTRRSWDPGPYRSLGASQAVNKWRPCDVLEAAREVLSGVRPSKH